MSRPGWATAVLGWLGVDRGVEALHRADRADHRAADRGLYSSGRASPDPARRTNVNAVVSLIFGILWLFWLGSLVAVVCGHVARGRSSAAVRPATVPRSLD